MEEERIESFDDTNWTKSDDEGDVDSSDSEFEDTDDTIEIDGHLPSLKKVINCAKTKIKKLYVVSSSVCDDVCQKLKEYYSADSHEYEHYNGKNLMIVIQNKDFDTSLQRHGSTADVENLKKTFKPLGFIVKSFKDLSGEKIDVKLRKARQKFNHKDASCFACVILSHGGQHETEGYQAKDHVLGTDERAISVEYIMKIFNNDNCPDLIGKPRLFFIQACRGRECDQGTDILVSVEGTITTTNSHSHVEQISNELEETFIDVAPPTPTTMITYPTPCYPDSMVMFASPPGYAAYARKGGSIFMSCLCDEFKNYNKRRNFFQILSRVANQMALDFETSQIEDSRYENCKIVPCLHSCLTRDIKFKKSND